ncbi:MAG: hypothetical protein V3S25_00850 [Nitrospirales bacterium]
MRQGGQEIEARFAHGPLTRLNRVDPGGRHDLCSGYEAGAFYDEMFKAPGRLRPHDRQLYERRLSLSTDELISGEAKNSGVFGLR